MTIISNTVANVPVVIVDQVRLTDEAALQELCEAIASEVEGGEIENVVLDFELVETIGSASLRMLLRAKSALQEKGALLHLCGLGPNVAKVMEETKLRQLFPVHDNVEAAQRAIQSGGSSWLSPGLRQAPPTGVVPLP
jgi:anti-anti-sigma factor